MENNINYEQKALLYAEKYGIIEYTVLDGNIMSYNEEFHEGKGKYATYNARLNLDTMKEDRVQI